jgi:hypothetical protein
MRNIVVRSLLVAICAGGLLQGSAAANMVVLDDFNRANGPLGSNWTVQTGSFGIVGNEVVGSGVGIATYNGVTANALEADVRSNTTNLQYVGLVLGYADLGNNLFMKVQQQGAYDGRFTNAAFYYGNNGSGNFFNLDSPFTSAHMRVELSGTTATMTFSDIDGGSGSQTYSYTYGSVPGTGIGILGFQGYATLDNFAADNGQGPVVPLPAGVVLGLLGLGSAGWRLSRKDA